VWVKTGHLFHENEAAAAAAVAVVAN